ncbi:CPBP family intramembrane glutamic endopeptidase [Streptomyces sp. NPDC048018]|uniref:CPBP family intramembrane glutamic endopeptidase n=1 Tax=Streptomyces sp. NPDC048018 TaxID=3365499 RepID=UPI003718C54B
MPPWHGAEEWAAARGVVSAPQGSRYGEQSRNGRQGAWRRIGEFFAVIGLLAAGTLSVVLFGMAVAAVSGVRSAPDGSERLLADPLADEALGLLSLAIGIPAVMLGVRWCGSRPAGTLASVTGRLRWRWLGLCAGLAFAVTALNMGALMLWERLADGDGAFAGETPGAARLVGGLAVFLVLVPFQAAAEEFVFRGWLPQFFGGFLRSPWPGVVVASVLFALAHGFGGWSGFLLLLYSSLWWGWLVDRTGGLEAVIALHTANNVLAYVVALVLGQLADTGTAADAPWQALVAELVSAPAYCLLVARLAKGRGVTATRPEEPAAAPRADRSHPVSDFLDG